MSPGCPPVGRSRRATALASLLLLLACGDDTGTGGQGGAGGAPSTPQDFEHSSCAACIQEACSAELTDCQSDPECTTYLSCLFACPVDASGKIELGCDDGCSTISSSEGALAQADLLSCRLYGAGASCEDCQLPNLPFGPNVPQECSPTEPAPNACRQCFWEKCCNTWDTCFAGGNAECDALDLCLAPCESEVPFEDCIAACFELHPDGIADYLAHFTCAIEHCAADTAPACDLEARPPCDTCATGTCGPTYIAMLSTEDGFLLNACLEDCDEDSDVTCVEACFDAHPAAQAAGFLWGECVSFECIDEC